MELTDYLKNPLTEGELEQHGFENTNQSFGDAKIFRFEGHPYLFDIHKENGHSLTYYVATGLTLEQITTRQVVIR